MNQNEKKVNTNLNFSNQPKMKIKSWWFFTSFHLAFFFIPIVYCLGYVLWFQSLIISISLSFILFWLFFKFLNQTFKGSTLKGYDPWHLRPLLNKHIPKIPLIIVKHETPFCSHYDFYGIRRMIFSSALLSLLEENELEDLLKYQKIYFEKGFSKSFTQLTYWVILLLFPIFFIQIFSKKFKINFIQKILSIFCRYLLFLPFYPWAHFKFFQLDKKTGDVLQDQNKYYQLLQKLQTYWEISPSHPLIFLSCLFLTNPLTRSTSYFNMQPPAQRRIKKITGRYSF